MTEKEMKQQVEAELNEIRSPIKAIRKKCLDCASTADEVRRCPIPSCPLFPFRFGKNPFRVPMSEERKEASRLRMKELRAANKIKKA